jgi:serine/threonine protein kinase
MRVRISDFGLATRTDPESLLASAQGTYAFLAPEVVRGKESSCASDVWSVGTLAYGPTSGGSMVAMARALVAARELAQSSGLPLTAFTLVSADQSDVPCPADATRNRTVSLLINAPTR